MPGKRFLHRFITCLISVFCAVGWAKAGISIDSVRTVASTCANNGRLLMYAQSTGGSLLYSIISGPVIFPLQTDNEFSSLPAGDYRVKLTNTSNEQLDTLVTVSGNYTAPDFTTNIYNPFCSGAATGSIRGLLTSGTGLAPFKWELAIPSAEVRPQQASDSFSLLPEGSYFLRLTDACNNIQTKVVNLIAPPASMLLTSTAISVSGCDSTDVDLNLEVAILRPPYQVSFTVGTSSYTVVAGVTNTYAGHIKLEFNAPGAGYGDSITNIVVTDACGAQLTVHSIIICSFDFYQLFIPIAIKGCRTGMLTRFYENAAAGCQYSSLPKFPVTITIKSSPDDQLVEIKQYTKLEDFPFVSLVMEPGKSYNVTFTNGCGTTKTNLVAVPAGKRYANTLFDISKVLLDSTCSVFINAYGFPTTKTTLTVTDGPPKAHSSKRKYAYTETYHYPKTFTGFVNDDSSMVYNIWNMSPGKYHFFVSDSCGNKYFDSCVISKNYLRSFNHQYNFNRGCAGQSSLDYQFSQNVSTYFTVTDTDRSDSVIYYREPSQMVLQDPFAGVINNITSPNIKLQILHKGAGFLRSMNNAIVDSFLVKDTMHLSLYEQPVLQASSTVSCNGQLYLLLFPDSGRGFSPYRYEIVAGPQLFPPQASHIFVLSQNGDYTVRLIDSCGNSVSVNVTVNNSSFPPLALLGNSCINNRTVLTYGSSPFFRYTWTRPGGRVFTGDSLFINPVTPADTGFYKIKREVSINGCITSDSVFYHLDTRAKDSIAVAVCEGDGYRLGNRFLTEPGIYVDTIASTGCDSIITVNLTVKPRPAVSLQVDDDFVARGTVIQLNATPTDLLAYAWQSLNAVSANVHDPTSIVNTSSWYIVQAKDGSDCSATDSVFVKVIEEEAFKCNRNAALYMPNAFSPTSSGINSRFKMPGIAAFSFSNYHFVIFDRWGNTVFESSNTTESWDGNFKEKPCRAGNYVYVLQFTCTGGRTFVKRGNVMLVR